MAEEIDVANPGLLQGATELRRPVLIRELPYILKCRFTVYCLDFRVLCFRIQGNGDTRQNG